jgi:hypothetical protein
MRESQRKEVGILRGRGMKEGEGHVRTQRALGEKGGFERDTRRMCVSKIITERRKEKEEKRSGLDGRMGGKGSRARVKKEGEGAMSSRRSLLQRRGKLSLARAQEETAPAGLSSSH